MFVLLVSVVLVSLNICSYIVKSESKSVYDYNNEYYEENNDYYNDDYDEMVLKYDNDNDNDEIVGGGFADKGEYKSIVSLGGCGGTILSQRWILTAAHCKGLGTRITVVAGEYNKGAEEGTEQRIVVMYLSLCLCVFVCAFFVDLQI